jgi:hypothetical protein
MRLGDAARESAASIPVSSSAEEGEDHVIACGDHQPEREHSARDRPAVMFTGIRRACHCLALVAVAVAWPWGASADENGRRTIRVRVYQTAALSAPVEQRALLEAEALLRSAFVDVQWQRCTGPDSAAVCSEPRQPAELLLRITRLVAPGQGALGEALVHRADGGGVLASVYVENVIPLARSTQMDVAVLLGRVVAHELAHLIMETPEHARQGLMRSNWTLDEIRRNRPPDWAFTPGDAVAMGPRSAPGR